MRNKGLIFDDNGLDPDWDISVWPFENGHLGYIEIHFRFARNPDTMAAIENMWNETFKAAIEEPVGVTPNVYGDRLNDMFGPQTSNYHIWLRKIKKAFDPHGMAVSSYYVTVKE